MARLLFFLALIPILLLLGSTPGSLHPVADSLAVFRFHIAWFALAGAVVLLVQGWRRSGLAVGALSLAAIGAIWWSYFPQTPNDDLPYSLYQKNLSFRLGKADDIIAHIKGSNADFVTLQEVTRRNTEILSGLSSTYAAQSLCKFRSVGGVAVASKYPRTDADILCIEELGLVGMNVQTPDGPVWLLSLHLSWPYPYSQAAHLDAILPTLENLKGPVVLGGDFNMVPWSYTMTRVETAIRAKRVGATNGTFLLEDLITIPIDHVLAPTNCVGEVSTLDLLGSDHHGVLARFTLEAC
ncbi:endonuclease/exonuclease/phosphatase family protein [Amylibacter sp. IMCC11727]|uniref:endonuclease/exonuclease/phosphatase family protein n=1 Tax=Amylibacter sp. IMCC11727 TaxID=3039851 RepID=UPI00244DF75D|nr:endonuclease/exonuclease/phosphatase family protein [Amylibacter sp. IMCC11727]WGI20451.1 endonuclease/exonuclease/phosphatase family protein [Amylibacter sp. IMCC11727]